MSKPITEKPYRTNRHSCYLLKYHLVVVVKYRHKVIHGKLRDRLLEISRSTIEGKWGLHIEEMDTDEDHIHILFEPNPQTQLALLVNNYKTVTSRLIRKEFAEELKPYFWKPYFWSDTYFIGTVGDTTDEVIKNYIRNQGKRKAANPS